MRGAYCHASRTNSPGRDVGWTIRPSSAHRGGGAQNATRWRVSAEGAVQVTRCPHPPGGDQQSGLGLGWVLRDYKHNRTRARQQVVSDAEVTAPASHEPIQRRRPDDWPSAAADHLTGLSASHGRKGPALAGALVENRCPWSPPRCYGSHIGKGPSPGRASASSCPVGLVQAVLEALS
jgi:hypothetical protein